MKTITRLILHQVDSGDVTLTLRLFEILNELERDQLDADALKNEDASARPPNFCRQTAPTNDTRLVFVNPLPGRWIRRTGCAIGLAFLMFASLANAASDSSIMDAANNAFAQGRYSEAAHDYESIMAQQGYSAPVLFNLANAQQRDGQLGPAILNYERAALLSPNDADIAANLQAARQKAGVEQEPRPVMQQIAQTLTMNVWLGLAAGALFLFVAAWLLKLLLPQARRSLNLGSVVAGVAAVVAAGALGLRSTELHRAVVMTPEAVVGVSPVTVAEPVFKLRAGEIVTPQEIHGDFARIRDHAGHEGWVKTGEIRQVIPVSSSSSDMAERKHG